ncbi:MAG: NUDIX hydrolase [Thermodesulfobacteriota bacterium]|nr:NUDIX hydrolase [Thermodesulfobacteriota bacterium]
MEERRPYVGIGVCVVKKGMVLLGKRRNAHGAGSWCFPGGHLEFGESIEQCARREVLEEAGLEIENLCHGPFTNDIFEKEGKHYVTLFVVADYAGGTLELKEPHKCERWQWFSWQDLPEPLFLPNQNLLKQGFKLGDDVPNSHGL